LPLGNGGLLQKREATAGPWELSTINPLLIVIGIRDWNSLPGIVALGIAAIAVGLSVVGRRLERVS